MNNNVNSILFLLRKEHNWEDKDVAIELGISEEEYHDMELGKVGVDMDQARKLSELYRIPAEYFLANDVRSFHYNHGERSHSNSGYIQNYSDYSELLKQLFEQLKEKENEIGTLRETIENFKNKK